MKRILVLASVLVGLTTQAQNLVPNPSFEDLIACPIGMSNLHLYLKNWYNPTNTSPDYFNVCAPPNDSFPGLTQGVPSNFAGYQPARNGNGYGAIGVYLDSVAPEGWANPREYIAVRLTEPLQADTLYCASFFLSLTYYALGCAVADVGMYFDTDSIRCSCVDTIGITPQVASDHNVLLQDTLNWMEVSGSFQAQGGERYIAIGNFLPNALTHVVLTAQPGNTNVAYYYVDDVSVIKCSQVGLSSNGLAAKAKTLELFPNPSSKNVQLKFDYRHGVSYQVSVTDITGRIVLDAPLNAARSLDVSVLSSGVYALQLAENGSFVAQAKLFVSP